MQKNNFFKVVDMQVLINKTWYKILKTDGNLALIQFESGKFVWNILGLETRKINVQARLF